MMFYVQKISLYNKHHAENGFKMISKSRSGSQLHFGHSQLSGLDDPDCITRPKRTFKTFFK